MNFKRIGRILVCLLLICCLTFHAMIPKAEATSVAVPLIQKAAVVTGNPFVIVAATLICLGIYKGVESGAFETVANNCVDALEAAGTWIKDGAMELLRTEDADGNASYYVDSGLMETLRAWMFDTSVVSSVELYADALSPIDLGFGYTLTCSSPCSYYLTHTNLGSQYTNGVLLYHPDMSSPSVKIYKDGSLVSSKVGDSTYSHFTVYVRADDIQGTDVTGLSLEEIINYFIGLNCPYYSDYDLNLGSLPSQMTDLRDGTSARQWSEDYTDRGLKVYGGGSGNNNNDGKWFWPVVLVAGADLLAMSQADAWAGETPQEFDDYDTKEELKVMDTPEVEFGFGIVLEPDSGDTEDPTQSTEPTTPGGLPDIGGGDEPDPGGDGNTGTESGNQTDYTSWFQKIIKGIEELPSKFESWITDCKTAIEELPSKFAEWFNNIAEKLERIWEQIQKVGETIVEGIQNVISSLFTPSPDYFTNKVEALKAKHHNIEKFTQLGNDFKLFFAGLGSKPPIIWIDLGAATGSYLWGGKQIFLDLTWYSQYKSKMDFILGAIIWLWLAWRVFLSVPGIINGASGVWGKYHRGGSKDDN